MHLSRPEFLTFEPNDFSKIDPRLDVVELKYDGHWGQVLIENGEWKIYSRNGTLRRSGKFSGTVGDAPVARTLLHGEFIFGTEWAKDHPDLYDKVCIFGAEEIYGQDVRKVTNEVMRRLITDFLQMHASEEITKRCWLIEQFPVDQAKHLWDTKVSIEKFEGLVFKCAKGDWNSVLGRMKFGTTIDYVCMGFEDSDSDTYAGWGVASVIGGLYKDGKLEETCKVSGLTDELRAEFYAHPEKYIGKVFETAGKKISKRGAMRHPEFMRWRDDKNAEECVWPPKGVANG